MWKLRDLKLFLFLGTMFLLAATAPAPAMDIVLTFNSSVSDFGANTNSMTSAVAFVAQQYDSLFTDNVTVGITVKGATGTSTFGGSSTDFSGEYSYTQVYNALSTNATQPAQQIALANLPATDPSPGGPSPYYVPTAEAAALGLLSQSNTYSVGAVTFGAGYSWSFNPNNRAVSGEYDFIGTVEHEMSEVLGRNWGLGNGVGGRGGGYYLPFDLFRYDGGTNTRDMTSNANVWFSINGGTTDLLPFNQDNGGSDTEDPDDWGVGVTKSALTNDAYNAYSRSGVVNGISPTDLLVMNVLGYHLSAAAMSGGTWAGNASGSWTVASNWSYPIIPTSGTVSFAGVPVNPNSPITVTLDGNQSAGALVFNTSGTVGYTLAQGASGALTLGTSNGASITVSGGPQVISAPMLLEGNLAVNVASGGSLQLSGVLSAASTGTGLSFTGPGPLIFTGQGTYSGNTTVNSGSLQVNAGGQLPAASEYIGTGATAAYLVQNGGTNTVSNGGNLQGLIVGYGSGSAFYNLNGGLLNSANEFISWSGAATFTQTGGTNQAGYLSVGTYYNGSYALMGGLVTASNEDINDSAHNGTFTQSGGTNAVAGNLIVGYLDGGSYHISAGALSAANAYIGYNSSGTVYHSGGSVSFSTALYLGYNFASIGSYNLSGSGRLSAPNEYIGYYGMGTITQTGGTNSVSGGNLYLGSYPGSSGTYNMSGGLLDPLTEFIGGGGNGMFVQSGGTNVVTNLSVSGGYYPLSAGVLDGAGGGTLSVVNGGFQTLGGVLDCSAFAAVVTGTGAMLDLSGNVLNTGGASLSVGSNSLLIVPQGFNSANYASYSNSGLTHTLGSTLSVSSGTGFGGWGTIADPVNCQGTITATPGGWINLNNGLSLADPGEVSLGTGTVVINDTNFSGMTGGSLTASLMVVGSNGAGSFAQSGGSSTLTNLYLGYNGNDSGTYLLSGGQLTVGGYEYVGLFGSGAFTQTGGTNAVSTLYLAEIFGAAGTYNLNGGLLSLAALDERSGTADFNIGGGTFQAASPFATSVPITLSTSGGNAIFDTNGNALALAGPLSGPGGLIVAGSGTLTLGVSNNYTGATLVSNGTLLLGDSNALSGSTFDSSGSGALIFQEGIGGFAFGGLQGSGGLLLTDAASADVALTVGGNNGNTTFSGNLCDTNGGGSLMKVGTGTLVLTGTNTYGGGTFVEGGRLIVTSNEGLADGSSLTVGNPTLLALFGGVLPANRVGAGGNSAEAGTTNAVPEPSAPALAAAGVILLAGWRLKSR